jgi:hypothetical protein
MENNTMKLQEGEYLIYKGIIAIVDEENDDLPTSNNIQFYEYIEGKYDIYDYDLDNRLDCFGMLATSDNIKEYIDDMFGGSFE